jgi:hypothetical protein
MHAHLHFRELTGYQWDWLSTRQEQRVEILQTWEEDIDRTYGRN